jgi:hypothetical protein
MRYLLALVFALLVVTLLAVPRASADGCRRVSYGYAAPASYAAPVYSAPAYKAPVYAAYQNYEVVKPYAVPFAYVPDTFYRVAPYLADAKVNAQIAEDAADRAARKATADILAALARSAAAGPSAPPSVLPPAPGPAPQAKAPANGPTIATVLENRCASCHQNDSPKSPKLTGDPGLIPEVVRLRSFHAVSAGRMPKNKPPLPQEEFDLLSRWVDEARPAGPPPAPALPNLPEVPKSPGK